MSVTFFQRGNMTRSISIRSHYFIQETETRIQQKERNIWTFYSYIRVYRWLLSYKTSDEELTQL